MPRRKVRVTSKNLPKLPGPGFVVSVLFAILCVPLMIYYFHFFKLVAEEATADGSDEMALRHVFAALLGSKMGKPARVLRQLGVDKNELYQELTGRKLSDRFKRPREVVKCKVKMSKELRYMIREKDLHGGRMLAFKSTYLWYCVAHAKGDLRTALAKHGITADRVVLALDGGRTS